jgi:catechol 2,3-dioxygenase-like lactoylglutathione lyase family enzyme
VPILRLDHIQLAMPPGREAEARRFYGELLGLREVPKPAVLAGRGGVWFEGDGGLCLHLGVEADFRPACKAHPAFLVDDLAGLVRTLAAAGHAITEDEPLPGIDRRFVHDPFGNRIELIERRAA